MTAQSGVESAALRELDLFASVDPVRLEPLAARLAWRDYRLGDVVLAQGDVGESFVLVMSGTVRILRSTAGVEVDLGSGTHGAIFGELSAITGEPRRASVIASSQLRVAIGGLDAFELMLDLPGVTATLREIAARRLAEIATMVPVTLADGTALVLRPLLPEDHDEVAAALRHQPQEWIYSRFFSGGMPSNAIIDYLVNVDYVSHFAWVIATAETLQGVGIARYIRRRDDRSVAEVAFGVSDDWRGRGLATLLLGALGAAATHAGIDRFQAETLNENRSMQRVLKKAGAHWSFGDAGVMTTTFPVTDARAVIPAALADALGAVAKEIVTGAGLAPQYPI